MKIKNVNILEMHVEKIVLAWAALFFLGEGFILPRNNNYAIRIWSFLN